jgi:integrase
MALTDLAARKLKPKDKEYFLADGGGLALRVRSKGQKAWFYRYRFDGRPRKMQIGLFPDLSLKDARIELAKVREELAAGIDPGMARSEAKQKRSAEPTFKELLDEFWEIELRHKKSGAATKAVIEKDCLKPWGWKKIRDVKRRDIVVLLDRVRKRAPILSNRLLGYLGRLFNFAAERGVIADSPCTRIRKPTEQPRSRVLTDDEIKLLWAVLELENKKVDIYHVSKLALKMILLTGQRPGEVTGMRFDEIDDDDFWNIPADRRKSGDPNRVPLNEMALDVVEQAKTYSGSSKFVFQSSHKKKKPIQRHALSRAIARHWEEVGFEVKWTPHDLRRTLRTRLAEIGVSDIVAERLLGHKLQGMLAVYSQHGYDEEKRQALSRWERRLKEIIGIAKTESNVVELGMHRG